MMMRAGRASSTSAVLFWTSLTLLFPSFAFDPLGVVAPSRHERFALPSEGLVYGRLIWSRQYGAFSSGGLLGMGSPRDVPLPYSLATFEFQRDAYATGGEFASFEPYLSQIGGQGLTFALFDRLIPVGQETKIQMFRSLTALLTALVLSLAVVWFGQELGVAAALVLLGSLVLSEWLLLFARDLFWSAWAFFLPMVAIAHWVRKRGAVVWGRPFFFLIVVVVFIKCVFNGYEFVTTTLVMMTVPIVYYRVLDSAGPLPILRDLAIAAAASACAVFLSFAILVGQISIVQGSLGDGVDHIVYSAQKRTYGIGLEDPDPDYVEGFEASLPSVLRTYLVGNYLDLNRFFEGYGETVSRFLLRLRFAYLVFAFAVASLALCLIKLEWSGRRVARALIVATWVSLLAPLSWLILFKSHSYIHTHLNFIVWHMPFTMFGFALCGFLAREAVRPRRSGQSLLATRLRP